MKKTPKSVERESFSEASAQAFVAVRNILLRIAHAQKENPKCPDWALREMLAIVDTAHNLPEFAIDPNGFSPEMLATCAKSYRQRYGAGTGFAVGFSSRFWNAIDKLIGPDLRDWTHAEEKEFQ